MSALIVHLPETPVTASTELEYALTADGSSVARHGAARAAMLPPPGGAGGEVVAVVPAALVSWQRVDLPRGVALRSPRLRQVLEGLLEDRLLDEPEQLHFALEPDARAEAPAWVAACDRAWLRGALHLLEAHGRAVTRIVPEFAPQSTSQLQAVGEPDHALLVLTGPQGVTALPMAAATLPLLPAMEAGTPWLAEPALAAQGEQLLQRPPGLQTAAERWVLAARSGWDLAQFEFANTGGARALKRLGSAWSDLLSAPEWRPARWGLALLLVLNLAALNAAAWRERSLLEAKRVAMRDMLTRSFPQVKVVVDAPLQMEKEVALLRQATGGASDRDLENLLGAVAGAGAPPGSVSAVDYSNGELRLKGLPAPQHAAIADALRGRGYTARSQADTLTVQAGEAR